MPTSYTSVKMGVSVWFSLWLQTYTPGFLCYFWFHSSSLVIPTAESRWRCQGGDEDEKQEDCLHVGAVVGKRKCRYTDSDCFLSKKA